jgi:hypothetical protein
MQICKYEIYKYDRVKEEKMKLRKYEKDKAKEKGKHS